MSSPVTGSGAQIPRQPQREYRSMMFRPFRNRLAAWLSLPGLLAALYGAEPPATLARTYASPAGSLHVSFALHPVRGPAFAVYEHLGGASYVPFTPTRPARTYLGTVAERPGAIAAGQLLDDGSMRTAIVFEDGTTWRGTGTTVTLPSPASWTPNYPTLLAGPGGAGSNVRAAEAGIDLTYTYYNQAGQNTGDALERAEWSVIQTNAIYLRDAALFHRIGRVIVRTVSTDDRSTSLSLLKSEWETVLPTDLPGSNHDLALAVQTLGSSGLAWVGAVGTANRYAWVSIRNSSTDGDFSTVWRHEAGHNWGCGHSEGGVPEGPTIMSGNGLGRFSSADIAKIVAHRDSRAPGLLDALGPWPSPLPPRANADRARALITGAAQALDILENDSDSNGDALTLLSFDTASHLGGTVSRVAATTPGGRDQLSYKPPASFTTGIDWFTYRIADATGLQSVAHVMIQPAPQEPDSTISADVVSVASGDWTVPATWDDARAAAAGHHYRVSAATTVDTPEANPLTFPGSSLQVAAGGLFRLRHTSGGGNTYQTIDLKSLILRDGSSFQSYNTAAGNVYRTLSSPLAIPGGSVAIRLQSDSGSAYTNLLALAGGLFGTGNINLTGSLQGQTGERRTLRVDTPASPFSGNWSVEGNNTSDNARRLYLVANAAGALGSGQVTLGTRAQLSCAADGGLDSISRVTVNTTTSTLDLVKPWDNPAASLVAGAGTIRLGAGHSRIGDLQLGGIAISPGTYTASELSAFGSGIAFSGTGLLSVGPNPPDAVSVADGTWDTAATWSHAQAAPTTGTQGEGLVYLIKGHTVSSSDPASNQQNLTGSGLRVADDGVLDLFRSHSGTGQDVIYDLPPISVNGGGIRFRADVGSCTHQIPGAISFEGGSTLSITGGTYSNNAILSGPLSGSGVISLVSSSGSSTVGNRRTFEVQSADNPFSGNWTIAQTAAGDDFAVLRASGARALGTGQVAVGARSILLCAGPQALDSLSAISLATPTSALELAAPLRNPAAALSSANGGTFDLGSGNSIVNSLTVGAVPVAPGIYDAGDLSTLCPGAAFTGSGYLTISGSQASVAPAYADWITGYAGAGTPQERDMAADADGDGLANMMEYLLHSDPTSGAGPAPLHGALQAGSFIVTFSRSKAAAAAGFGSRIEYSTTLDNDWTASTPAMTQVTDDGSNETVVVTIPLANGGTRCFARIRCDWAAP